MGAVAMSERDVAVEPLVTADRARQLAARLAGASATEVVRQVAQACVAAGTTLKLASSLGAEDQVLTHMLRELAPDARVFVLDTGRLHQQTYDLMSRMMTRYGFQYEVYAPQAEAVQEMVSAHGPNLFYASVENRKRCCFVRKVEPLNRALQDAGAWMTGLRRGQSDDRADTPVVEWDEAHGALKVNPLATWSEQQVWDYLREHRVPYNELHDHGYPSIGCQPCTRAIDQGEDPRAGRWWWENGAAKECGLHTETVPPRVTEAGPTG